VVFTQAAWQEGNEVVEVRYRPEHISFEELLSAAEAKSCTTLVYTTTDEQLRVARARIGDKAKPRPAAPERSKESDQLYYLRLSPLRYLPLTPIQARQINAALGHEQDPSPWLSPRTAALAEEIEHVLASAPDALAGLERPAEVLALSNYERELRQRLAALR
jgi:hypothetical protein